MRTNLKHLMELTAVVDDTAVTSELSEASLSDAIEAVVSIQNRPCISVQLHTMLEEVTDFMRQAKIW